MEIQETSPPPSRTTRVIMARLEKAIETGVYADGDQLPAERQLAITFGTARSTIRKVLDELEKKDLVVRRVGSGTFVNYPGPRHQGLEDVADLVSPLQLMRREGPQQAAPQWQAVQSAHQHIAHHRQAID